MDHCALTSDETMIGFFGSPVSVTMEVVDVGLTNLTTGIDEHPALQVQVGYGPIGTVPDSAAWSWKDAQAETTWLSIKGADGYVGDLVPDAKGTYEVAGRTSLDGGVTWLYCDRVIGSSDGYQSEDASHLTIQANPCAEEPCPAAPPAICAADGLTLLTYGDDAFCTPIGPQEIDCVYPTIDVSCAAQGLACKDGACKQEIVSPTTFGELALTEVLLVPSSGLQEAQWFEILNDTGNFINLKGCWLSDGHEGSHYIDTHLVISPGEFQVFAGSNDPGVNGGIEAAYGYGSDLNLKLGGSGLAIACGGVIIDSLQTQGEYIIPTGTAISLSFYKQDAALNDEPFSWCQAVTPFGDGDLGTPGTLNPDCPNDEVTVKNCTLLPGLGEFAKAGESRIVEIEFVVSEKTLGVEVVPLVEIGVGPAGTSPDSPEWDWKLMTKQSDLADMSLLDPGSGLYATLYDCLAKAHGVLRAAGAEMTERAASFAI